MKVVRKLVVLMAVAIMVLTASRAVASTIALDFVGVTENRFQFANTFGWSFTVNAPIAVDGLGFFDSFITDGAGILQDHRVDLWTGTGTLLAQTTITNASTQAATTAAQGRWLFNTIVPVLLMPGTYVISTFNAESPPGCTTCDGFRFLDTATTDPAITFIEAVGFPGADQFPTIPIPIRNDGYFGPNFTFVAVPEPASLLLVGTGIAGVVARRRRRQHPKNG
jgi:hypothetical protein